MALARDDQVIDRIGSWRIIKGEKSVVGGVGMSWSLQKKTSCQ
jgi:hypothetical protein